MSNFGRSVNKASGFFPDNFISSMADTACINTFSGNTDTFGENHTWGPLQLNPAGRHGDVRPVCLRYAIQKRFVFNGPSFFISFRAKDGGGGGSRTYIGPYSHKGLQQFTECLLNIYSDRNRSICTES